MNLVTLLTSTALISTTAFAGTSVVDSYFQNASCEKHSLRLVEYVVKPQLLHDPQNTAFFAQRLAVAEAACKGAPPADLVNVERLPARIRQLAASDGMQARAQAALEKEKESGV